MTRLDQLVDADRIPKVEVMVTEPLDARSVPWLTETLASVLAVRPVQVVVDLGGCPVIDAECITVLLDAHRRLRRDGGHLTLRDPSERLRRNLRLMHTERVLHVVPERP